ncbi:MAG: EscU/YscU/HrcU family type III secretion system export apparatus switch protein [Alphaproteobacteria bacterium]|nr:EscU/YscU/HrcU family type III secretion system export apparatus switch protein [Alphaproteobacteria bacterium]
MSPRDDQTEAPTDARLRKAVDMGDRPRSRDLVAALTTAAGFAALVSLGGWLAGGSAAALADAIRLAGEGAGVRDGAIAVLAAFAPALAPFAAVLAATIAVALAAGGLGGGLSLPPRRRVIEGARVDPMAGIRRMLGVEALGELAKSVLKLVAIGLAAAAATLWMLPALLGGAADLPALAAMAGRGVLLGGLAIAVALVVAALPDLALQRRLWRRRSRMSRQEQRDEAKEQDGAPETRAAQRRRRLELARRDVRAGVAQAHAVIVNPLSFAVALRYRRGRDAAPLIVARGRHERAAAIRGLAREAGIPVLSYPDLARALYFGGRDGEAIPGDLYRAVAVVLAFVFSTRWTPAPVVDVPDHMLFDGEGRRLAPR